MADQINIDNYKPVACSDYDVYEIAIMQNRNIDLSWKDQYGKSRHEIVRPVELKIKEGAEYLLFQTNDTNSRLNQNNHTVRLDRIQRAAIVNN